MIEGFQEWFNKNLSNLERCGIVIAVSEPTREPLRNSIAATAKSDNHEALICLWETGECAVDVGDFRRSEVDSFNYEFHSREDLSVFLETFFAKFD